MGRPPFTVIGAAGVAAGCAGVVAMLPGAAAGAIGISGSSALARTLSPVAERSSTTGRVSALHADATTFCVGLTLLTAAFALSFWRRRRGDCRPLVRLPRMALR